MINAVFARPVGIFDNWFNKVVSYMTGGDFCHSEFVFSWTQQEAAHFFKLEVRKAQKELQKVH